MNIVLIGMRGSGKTTVGRILAARLKRQLVEMDDLIVQKAGISIPEIVERYGWEKFRDLEAEIAGEVARLDNIVNATGGGVATREQNVRELKRNGVVIWLTASTDSLLQRIGDDKNRPSLLSDKTPEEEIEITYNERKSLYQQAADLVVDTENKTPQEVAETIIGLLAGKGRLPPIISGKTKVCCLIGDPVEHSLSPLIHNTAYKALGLDFVYVPFRVESIKQAIEGIRGLGIRGASVTIPYKTALVNYLDSIDDAAREIGAVNTIVNENGRLKGFNTDWTAAVKALEEVVALESKKMLLIGGGGAASAIAVGLKKKGAKLVILDRTIEKARALAGLVNAEDSGGLERLPSAVAGADILINATSVGMLPNTNESLIPKKLLHGGLTVFDIVYNPRETKLLREARDRGCTIVYGYKMLLYQAVLQFELFTGCRAPLPVMEQALVKALGG